MLSHILKVLLHGYFYFPGQQTTEEHNIPCLKLKSISYISKKSIVEKKSVFSVCNHWLVPVVSTRNIVRNMWQVFPTSFLQYFSSSMHIDAHMQVKTLVYSSLSKENSSVQPSWPLWVDFTKESLYLEAEGFFWVVKGKSVCIRQLNDCIGSCRASQVSTNNSNNELTDVIIIHILRRNHGSSNPVMFKTTGQILTSQLKSHCGAPDLNIQDHLV